MSRLVSSDYYIAEAENAHKLAHAVGVAMKAGWQLRGGVSIAIRAQDPLNPHTPQIWYAQALVLEMWISDGND